MITIFFLARNSRTNINVRAGGLVCAWWLIASKKYSLLTVQTFNKNLWCTTSLQLKKAVSKIFTFDRTCFDFFGLGYSTYTSWIDFWYSRASRTRIFTDFFSAFLKPFVSQLNLCFAYSRLVNILKILIQFLWSIFSKSKKSKCAPKLTDDGQYSRYC